MTDRPNVGDTFPMLKGPSAIAYARIAIYSAIGTSLSAVVWLFLARAAGSTNSVLSPVAVLLLIVAFVGVFTMVVMLLLAYVRSGAEARAHYTTAWRKYRYFPELNPKTGKVVRAADEPYLDRATYKARMKAE